MEVANAGDSAPYQSSGESRFPWGCLFGGCLAVVLVVLTGAAVVTLGGYYFYKGQLNKYTSTESKELPQVKASSEEIAAIESRIEDFKEKVENGEETDELVLTADEINALISKEEKMRGKVFVRISEGKVTADVSIPADQFPGGKGRFFNGSVTIKVQLDNGVLIVTVDQAEVNGEPVPETFMEGLRKENLAKETYKDADTAKQLARIEKIEIAEDRIVLKVRPAKKEEAGVESSATDAADSAAAPQDPTSSTESVDGADVPNADDGQGADDGEPVAEVESVE